MLALTVSGNSLMVHARRPPSTSTSTSTGRTRRLEPGFAIAISLLAFATVTAPPRAAADDALDEKTLPPAIDWPMDSDPELSRRTGEDELRVDQLEIWGAMLMRPELRLRVTAAEEIRFAASAGFVDELSDLVPVLLAALERAEAQDAFLSIAAALGELDVADAADALLARLEATERPSPELALTLDPLLLRWRPDAAAAIWLRRLEHAEPGDAEWRSAVTCLGLARAEAAGPELLELLDSAERPTQRLILAEAIGRIRATGLEPVAAPWLDRGQSGRLVAIRLLARHESQRATRMLQPLLSDGDETLKLLAATRLGEVRPDLLQAHAAEFASARRPGLRAIAVSIAYRDPTPARLEQLAPLTADPSLRVRRRAMAALVDLHGRDPVRADVNRLVESMLDDPELRFQGAALYGLIGDDATRLTPLLDVREPETRLAAITAMRRVGIEPVQARLFESLQQQLRAHRQITAEVEAAAEAEEHGRNGFDADEARRKYDRLTQLDREMAQILQSIWRIDDPRFTEFALSMVPKQGEVRPDRARAAAIWALGKRLQGQSHRRLVDMLVVRLRDRSEEVPPSAEVQLHAMVALGRLDAKAAVAAQLDELSPWDGSAARQWMLQAHGLPVPESREPPARPFGDWMIEPL